MTDHDDLLWLTAEQPSVTAPDSAQTARARRALITHASTPQQATVPQTMRAAASRRRPERAWLRPSRVLALAATAAALAAATVGIPLLSNGGGTLGVPEASAAPLVALSQRVLSEPEATGDATLVVRTHAFAKGEGFTGADLYHDDGRYFFATTRGKLARQVRRGADQPNTAANIVKAVRAAASANLPIGTARDGVIRAMLKLPAGAPLPPADAAPPAPVPGAAPPAAVPGAAPPAAVPGGAPPRRAPRAIRSAAQAQSPDDNYVWITSMEALLAQGGQPEVRAGALRLIASIPTIRVSPTTIDNRPALKVTSTPSAGGGVERLVLDNDTGRPLRFEGGPVNGPPDVTVTYEISRVTAAEFAGSRP